jgi:predicted P-loop ATPase/GTPase
VVRLPYHFTPSVERVIKISQDIDDYVKATINGYKEKVDYLEELLSNNAKIADNINNSIKEYKEFCYKNMEEINKIVFEKQKITSRNLIDQQTNNDDETPQ